MSATHHVNYKKIYIALLVLLAVSIAGPMVGIPWLTLITAFGIAIVKATLVVQNFMHLKWEKKIMKWVLLTSVVIVALFWAAVRSDVGAHSGRNWTNNAAQAAVARGIAPPDHGETPAGGEHEAPAAPGHDTARAAPAAPPAAAFDAAAAFQAVCSGCHGQTGGGNGPAGAGMNPPPANFTTAAFWTGKTDDHIVKVIREGGASVGKSPMMPAWGSLYNEAQAREIAAWLRTLRR